MPKSTQTQANPRQGKKREETRSPGMAILSTSYSPSTYVSIFGIFTRSQLADDHAALAAAIKAWSLLSEEEKKGQSKGKFATSMGVPRNTLRPYIWPTEGQAPTVLRAAQRGRRSLLPELDEKCIVQVTLSMYKKHDLILNRTTNEYE